MIAAALRKEAEALGFDGCRIVAPDAVPEAGERLAAWLADGAHGAMNWMAETADRRRQPASLWPEVCSVIMLAVNYGPDHDALENLARPEVGSISVYARHRDYHDVIKGRLKHLAGWLARQGGADVKVFVDTAPIMEKPLAAAAGLGWQGRHTNLVSRDFGSWLFLGSIFTTLDLPRDPAETDHCGSCHACLDVCPTNAFPAPYRLDARRCISYLTIEHPGHIDRDLRPLIGNRIYGCDDCLAVCPWNKFAATAREAKLQGRADLRAPALADLVALDDAGFRSLFSGSPIKRIGHARFVRNVLIAIGNSGQAALAPAALARLTHTAPEVRAAAAWAGIRLLGRTPFLAQAGAVCHSEPDPAVRAEWAAERPECILSGERDPFSPWERRWPAGPDEGSHRTRAGFPDPSSVSRLRRDPPSSPGGEGERTQVAGAPSCAQLRRSHKDEDDGAVESGVDRRTEGE